MKTTPRKPLLLCAFLIGLLIVAGGCASDDSNPEDSADQPAKLLREVESDGAVAQDDPIELERNIAEPSETSTSAPPAAAVAEPSGTRDPEVATTQPRTAPDTSAVPDGGTAVPNTEPPVSPDVSVTP